MFFFSRELVCEKALQGEKFNSIALKRKVLFMIKWFIDFKVRFVEIKNEIT